MAEKTWTLTDHDQDIYVDQIALGPEHAGGTATGYRVTKRTLQTGLSQGVEVIEVQNGDFRFVVVPTRGMGVWKAQYRDVSLGWKSPVCGPVHPSFVQLSHPDGIGWLDGFDELIVRCGLESNGAPEFLPNGRLRYGLHGKIANIPAHKVEVVIDGDAGRIAVRGVVDETRLFGAKLRLETSIETHVGRPGLVIHDRITNRSASPGEFELLYHVNLGSPLLEPGGKVNLPVKRLAPRDATAATDLASWNVYGPETPGSSEVCFFTEPLAGADGDTSVVLHNAAANRGVSLKFNVRQLPFFTLWKNREAVRDGYVTGLEPAVNLPNIKSFEQQMGRVATIGPGESRDFRLEMEPLADTEGVSAALSSIARLQQAAAPEILSQPDSRWSSSG